MPCGPVNEPWGANNQLKSRIMENHKDISLSQLRNYIIRYGAKCMENHESDLFYDCRAVETLLPGESIYWMVSELHTYLYTVDEIIQKNLDVGTLFGDRCNFKITCTNMDITCETNKFFDMKRLYCERQLLDAVEHRD